MINEEDIIKKPFWVRWLCPHSFTGGVRVICDKKGNIYEKRSFVISEVFDNTKLMETAYYAKKIPQYIKGLETGEFVKVGMLEARAEFLKLMEKYDIKTISAYNLMFDMKALKSTFQTLGYGKKFLPSETRYTKDNIDLFGLLLVRCYLLKRLIQK